MPNSVNTNIFNIQSIAIGNPAAGNAFTFSNTDENRLQILSISHTLTTDGTAANRTPEFHIIQGGLRHNFHASGVPQIASTVRTISWLPFGTAGFQANVAGIITIPMSLELFLNPGDDLVYTIDSMQAGDLITSTNIRVKLWVQVD